MRTPFAAEYFQTKTAMPFVQPGRTSVPGALGAAAFGGAAGLGGAMAADRMMVPPTPLPQFAPIPSLQERVLSGQEPIHSGVSLPLSDPRLGNIMPGPHVNPLEMNPSVPSMQSDMTGTDFYSQMLPN